MTKFKPEVIDKLLEAIEAGATYELACSFAGITYQTLRNWLIRSEGAKSGKFYEFAKRLKESEGRAAKTWLDIIEQAAIEGDWKAAAWKLERRFFEDYGRRVRSNVIQQNIEIDLDNLTNEQLQQLARGDSLEKVLGQK